jgi:hypothetical protein
LTGYVLGSGRIVLTVAKKLARKELGYEKKILCVI